MVTNSNLINVCAIVVNILWPLRNEFNYVLDHWYVSAWNSNGDNNQRGEKANPNSPSYPRFGNTSDTKV